MDNNLSAVPDLNTALETKVEYLAAKTIVTKTKNTWWFGTDYNMNIYRGCCHGCIYCDSRSECYHVDNFDTVRAKQNALEIIRNDLRRKVKTGVIGTGSMSDPYNPFEKELRLTRNALELTAAYKFGVAIATKSPLIARDADVLSYIQTNSPVICKLTITTADDALCRLIEPNVAPSGERFAAIQRLSGAGIYAGVLLMPLLPFINDTEENVLAVTRAAKESGARFVYSSFGVTLRANQRDYFYNRLDELFPGIKAEYVKKFRNTYSCVSPAAKKLAARFEAECEKLGLLYRMEDITRNYKLGFANSQLSFLW